MDPLKLFYESKLGGSRRRPGDRAEPAPLEQRTSDAAEAAEAVDTAEKLLRHLEERSGRPLRSCAAIDAYVAAQPTEMDTARPAGRSLLRETLLVLFLVAAALQYYYVDVSLEIAALKRITVFVPVYEAPLRRSVDS